MQENSEQVWRFFRYDLIYEYMDRPTLAAPFIIVSHAFRLLKYCMRTSAGVPFESDFGESLSILPAKGRRLEVLKTVSVFSFGTSHML